MSLLAGFALAATAVGTSSTPEAVGRAGAAMPFLEYEAEQAMTNGIVIGPDRREGMLAAEASGRRAVLLERAEHSVVFALTARANALTIRYSLPDSANGAGASGQLALLADGEPVAVAPVTSRFAWFYGRYPFTNRPRDGAPQHYWDEVRVLLPRSLAAGTRISLAKPADMPWIAIDLLDAEIAPPHLQPPANALSVLQFGADPSGRNSSLRAFRRAIRAAQRDQRPLYIPPGRYRVEGHLQVDRVTISGAGPWHSLLVGAGLGFYARPSGSSQVSLSNFAVQGEVDERRDHAPLAAIGGVFNASSFTDLFLAHAKVGAWLDGPASGLTLRRLRITDQAADGINLHRGITDALVEQNFIRNTGDDGIALWSHRTADSRVTIRNNTVVAPVLANGIALYGGSDLVVRDNLVADTVTQGGGIHLGTRFASAPFSGLIELSGNVLLRTGSFDPNWRFGVGALWLYALERPIGDAIVTINNTVSLDSSCEAIQLLGPRSISGIRIDGFTAMRSGDAIAAVQASGSIVIANASSMGRAEPDVVRLPEGFSLVDGGGNRGWTIVRRASPGPPRCDAVQSASEIYQPAASHASGAGK